MVMVRMGRRRRRDGGVEETRRGTEDGQGKEEEGREGEGRSGEENWEKGKKEGEKAPGVCVREVCTLGMNECEGW